MLAAARSALADDSSRGAEAARRACADSARRLEGVYFSGKALSGDREVFPLPPGPPAAVRASPLPPLLAFLKPETLPPDLAPYLFLDASGAPAAAPTTEQ